MNQKIKALALAFLTCFFGMAVAKPVYAAAQEDRKTEIVRAVLSEDGQTLQVEAALSDDFLSSNGARGVFLFEFMPYEKFGDINQKAPVSERIAAKELTFEVDFTDDAARRKYCKYILAISKDGGYETLGSAKYIDNPEVYAAESVRPVLKQGKAGVLDRDTALTSKLDVCQSIVLVPLNELVADGVEGAQRIEYAGKTYFVDKEQLISLDNQVRALSEQGVEVYLQLVLTPSEDSMADSALTLYEYSKSKIAEYCAVNTSDEEGADLYCALVEFLVGRYTRSDFAYGFAPNIIFGYQVNAGRKYNSMGETNASTFISLLSRSVRMTSTAVRSVSDEARLFVSFGSNFHSAVTDPAHTPNDRFDYSAKQVLDGLASILQNVPFGIALSASASDGRADFWNDPLADFTQETPFVTMKNIEVLTEYLKQPSMMCGGYVRELIVSEFTADGGDGSLPAQNAQAAALVCAYYKAYQTQEISAFIYGSPLQGKETDAALRADGNNRLAFTAFQGIGGLGPDEILSRMETYMDADSYAAVSQGAFGELFVSHGELPLYTRKIPERSTQSYLANFTDNSLYGFGPDTVTASVQVTILNDAGIVLNARSSADKAGVVKAYEAYDLSLQDAMSITLMARTDSASANYTLTLTGERENEEVVLSAQGSLTPGAWTDMTFDLSGLDTLTHFALGVSAAEEEDIALLVKDIRLYDFPVVGSTLILTILVWTAAIVLFIFLLLYIRFMIVSSRRARRNRQALAEKIRAENNQMTYRYNRRASAPAGAKPPAVPLRPAPVSAAARPAAEKTQSAPPAPAGQPAPSTRAIPEMPKTEPKVYIVPPRPKPAPEGKRPTLNLGIEQSSAPGEGFNTTESAESAEQGN